LDGIKQGEDYINLAKVIIVNILDFEYLKLDRFHTKYHLWEDALHEQANMLSAAKAEGREEGKLAMAKNFLSMGIDAETIAKAAELPNKKIIVNTKPSPTQYQTFDRKTFLGHKLFL
jgi:hypothetical protein